MTKDFIIKVPLVNQIKETGNKKWVHQTCAICVLKMILIWKKPKLAKVKIMDLVKRGLKMDGYMEKIGWKHQALVDIASKYGLKLKREFEKTKTGKIRLNSKINKEIINGRPVVASIFYKLNKMNGGHMVVINGLQKKGNTVTGYYIQDPDPRFRGNNYFVAKKEFIKGWRGGMLYLK